MVQDEKMLIMNVPSEEESVIYNTTTQKVKLKPPDSPKCQTARCMLAGAKALKGPYLGSKSNNNCTTFLSLFSKMSSTNLHSQTTLIKISSVK